ncbi:hypothetical protein L208DRAFT_1335660, partial [Tricholoma matsutake]
IHMYLLNNPDHYYSHNFRNCYWKAFVTTTRSCWVANIPTDQAIDMNKSVTKVAILKQGRRVVGLSPVLDYIWRPLELGSLSLYDWIINCTHKKRRKSMLEQTIYAAQGKRQHVPYNLPGV